MIDISSDTTTYNTDEKGLAIHVKLPAEIKTRLDSITCTESCGVISKTKLITVLLARFFDGHDRGHSHMRITIP